MILPVVVAVADVESDDDIDERDGEVDRLLRRAEGRKFSIWRRGAHSSMAHSWTPPPPPLNKKTQNLDRFRIQKLLLSPGTVIISVVGVNWHEYLPL